MPYVLFSHIRYDHWYMKYFIFGKSTLWGKKKKVWDDEEWHQAPGKMKSVSLKQFAASLL